VRQVRRRRPKERMRSEDGNLVVIDSVESKEEVKVIENILQCSNL
jgi:hypothetical protein